MAIPSFNVLSAVDIDYFRSVIARLRSHAKLVASLIMGQD